MTAQQPDGRNSTLYASSADWISPANQSSSNYQLDPPVANGRKVIIADTDHIFGTGGDGDWVWKSFTRGLNPIYMDPLDSDPTRVEARRAMGQTLQWSKRINLSAMAPHPELVSTKYALANPGFEYLVYLPCGRTLAINLARGAFEVEWFNVSTGDDKVATRVEGGAIRGLIAPFDGPAVAHIVRR
jgi:hypothetical protein